MKQVVQVEAGRKIVLPEGFKEGALVSLVKTKDGTLEVSLFPAAPKPKKVFYLQELAHLWKNKHSKTVVRLFRVYDGKGNVHTLISVPAKHDQDEEVRFALRSEMRDFLKKDDFGLLLLNGMHPDHVPALLKKRLLDDTQLAGITKYERLSSQEEREYKTF